jgi:hypothetical protein
MNPSFEVVINVEQGPDRAPIVVEVPIYVNLSKALVAEEREQDDQELVTTKHTRTETENFYELFHLGFNDQTTRPRSLLLYTNKTISPTEK